MSSPLCAVKVVLQYWYYSVLRARKKQGQCCDWEHWLLSRMSVMHRSVVILIKWHLADRCWAMVASKIGCLADLSVWVP